MDSNRSHRDAAGDADRDPTSGDDFDVRLRSLLPSIAGDEPDGPLPDAARVAAHFSGVGDEALIEEASRRSEVRRLLRDIADVADVGDADGVALRDGDMPSALSPQVEAAALAAFDAPSREERAAGIEPIGAGVPDVSSRRRGLAAIPFSLRIAAAVALVAVPLAFGTFGRAVEAGPLLKLRGIDRLDGGGVMAAEGPVTFSVGARISPKSTERMSLRLSDGSRIVLAGGDEAQVVCDGSTCSTAALRLDRGEAVLSSAGTSVVLLLPDGSRFELDRGVAHVVVSPSGEPAASLRFGANARWTPPGGKPSDAVKVKGPGSHLLDRFGLRLTGPAADSLFRDLEFFGGEFIGASAERVTGAGHWRLVDPEMARPGVAAHPSDAAGVPALRLDVPKNAEARLAWTPDAEALAADRVTIVFRARPSSVGPGGIPIPDIPTPWLTVSVRSRDGKELLGSASVGVEAGTDRPFRLEIPLPDDFPAVGRGGVILTFRSEEAGASAWFEGAAFKPRRTTPSPAPSSR